jgi:hypothetical protein
MKAIECVEVAIKPDQVQKHAFKRAPDRAPEEALDNEQPQSPNWNLPFLVDGSNFETFLGGAGI